MVHLASVSFNQLPSDAVCVFCHQNIQETEDTYHRLSSVLDLAAPPPKYIIHKNPNGEPYGGSLLHAFCFDRWAIVEMTARRALRCFHCNNEVTTLDGRRLENIYADRIVPHLPAEEPAEEWGDLELVIGPILDRQREIREQIEELLLEGRLPDGDCHSLIIWAAKYNRMDIIRIVIANRPIPPISIQLAIVPAIRHGGHIEVVQGLLATGVITEHWRGIAVKHAAEFGYREIVQLLLAQGPITAHHKESAILLAWHNPPTEMEIIQLLIAHGALSVVGRECLILEAIRRSHIEMVRFLIENGRISSPFRKEALRLAADFAGGDQMIEILKKARTVPSPITLLLGGSAAAVVSAIGIATLLVKD